MLLIFTIVLEVLTSEMRQENKSIHIGKEELKLVKLCLQMTMIMYREYPKTLKRITRINLKMF